MTAADAAAFRAIRLRALHDHPTAYGSTLSDWQDAPLDAFRRMVEARTIFGLFPDAVAGGDLSGIAAYDRERGGNTRHRAFVQSVYVVPDIRGRGGCGRLVGAIEAAARRDGVLQLELHVAEDNAAAMAAYAKAGFAVAGVSPRAILCAGRFIDEVLMILRLD